jgi:hypothetical protein
MPLWLDAARALLGRGHVLAALALGAAWLVAIMSVLAQAREAFGLPAAGPPAHAIPMPARLAMLATGVAILAMAIVTWGVG